MKKRFFSPPEVKNVDRVVFREIFEVVLKLEFVLENNGTSQFYNLYNFLKASLR